MNLSLSLNRLLVFVVLTECRSFRECGRRLKRTQPTISRQIAELESELGKTLFIRDPHRVELTDEGRRLLAQVNEPLRQIERALGEARGSGQAPGLRGPLRFGTLTEVGQSVLFGLVTEFSKRHPEVAPDVRYIEQRQIREQLLRGELDFGIVARAFDTETLRSHKLLTERIVLLGRPELKLPPGKGARLPLVSYRADDPLVDLFEKKFSGRKKTSVRIVCSVNSHRSMIEALLNLEAFAFMPRLSARAELASGRLREVPGYEIQQSLFLGYAVQEHENAVRKAFREYLLGACRKGL